jgi:hypothetical protein
MVELVSQLEDALTNADEITDGEWIDAENREVIMETLRTGYNIVRAIHSNGTAIGNDTENILAQA